MNPTTRACSFFLLITLSPACTAEFEPGEEHATDQGVLLASAPLAMPFEFGGSSGDRANRLCLDVQWGGSENGTPVQAYPCNGTAAQDWAYLPSGHVRNEGSGKCLDTGDDGRLKIWDCATTSYQEWISAGATELFLAEPRLAVIYDADHRAVLGERSRGTPNAYFGAITLVNVGSNKVLQNAYHQETPATGTPVTIGSFEASNTTNRYQHWQARPAQYADGTTGWWFLNGITFLGTEGGRTANGTRIVLTDRPQGKTTAWQYTLDGALRNIGSGRCMGVSGGSTDEDAELILWDCDQTPSQGWYPEIGSL